MFIAASIEIMEMKLIPMAVVRALVKTMPLRTSMTVSSRMLVIRPLIMANVKMKMTGAAIS